MDVGTYATSALLFGLMALGVVALVVDIVLFVRSKRKDDKA
jgi:hypothetical protein